MLLYLVENFNCLYIFCFLDRESFYNFVNKTNLVHSFPCMFISILYMFRTSMCPLSGEITVSMRRLVFVTVWLAVWYAGWDEIPSCIPDGHPHRVTNTRRRIDTVISPDYGHILVRNM
jgi:hypothetical protein